MAYWLKLKDGYGKNRAAFSTQRRYANLTMAHGSRNQAAGIRFYRGEFMKIIERFQTTKEQTRDRFSQQETDALNLAVVGESICLGESICPPERLREIHQFVKEWEQR